MLWPDVLMKPAHHEILILKRLNLGKTSVRGLEIVRVQPVEVKKLGFRSLGFQGHKTSNPEALSPRNRPSASS